MSDTETLARDLRETAANLSAYIEQRAQEIAGPRIAAAEQAAAERVADVEDGAAVASRRYKDLIAELRRQLDVQLRFQEQHIRGRCAPVALEGTSR